MNKGQGKVQISMVSMATSLLWMIMGVALFLGGTLIEKGFEIRYLSGTDATLHTVHDPRLGLTMVVIGWIFFILLGLLPLFAALVKAFIAQYRLSHPKATKE